MTKIKPTVPALVLSWEDDDQILDRKMGFDWKTLPTVHWHAEKGGDGDWSVWRTANPENPITVRVGVGSDFAMARAIAEIDAARAYEIRRDARFVEVQEAACDLVSSYVAFMAVDSPDSLTGEDLRLTSRLLAQAANQLADRPSAKSDGSRAAVRLADFLSQAAEIVADDLDDRA